MSNELKRKFTNTIITAIDEETFDVVFPAYYPALFEYEPERKERYYYVPYEGFCKRDGTAPDNSLALDLYEAQRAYIRKKKLDEKLEKAT